jgi:dephospho-CoA kinase
MILGITGSIAAGKSTIANIFKEFGVPVVSADELARTVVQPGQPALRALQQRFGDSIITATGELDREKLAKLVFVDPAARQDLNKIVHPAIAILADQTLQQLKDAGHPLIGYEAPLLFEAGAENRVDAILMVRIAPELQRQRLSQRDDLSDAEITARIATQLPQEEKVARSDYVIDNSGPLETTYAQVKELFHQLT